MACLFALLKEVRLVVGVDGTGRLRIQATENSTWYLIYNVEHMGN